jgi:hypothetical protein
MPGGDRERISALEGCRSGIEFLDHRIGDRYSFLDKGMPDREAWADAEREIGECEELLAGQRREYAAIIAGLRKDAPALLDSWAEEHAERLRRLEPLTSSMASSESEAEMLRYLINVYIKEWRSVSSGRDEPVIEHPSLWVVRPGPVEPGI